MIAQIANRIIRQGFSRTYKNYINGEWVDSKSNEWFDLKSPVTQDLVARSPLSSEAEFNSAV